MNDVRFSPKLIDLDLKKSELRINWQDGHPSAYSLSHLRRCCPCSDCQTLRAHQDPLLLLNIEENDQRMLLQEDHPAEVVSENALRFKWSDGHEAGIYSFAYLRAICPCPACTEKDTRELFNNLPSSGR